MNTMNTMPMIIILILVIKGGIKGKERKIKILPILLIPILFIYVIYQTLSQTSNIPNYYYGVFLASFIIGSSLGIVRSKFYTYSKDESGNIFYKRGLTDAIILVVYIILETILRLVFKSFEANLFTLINTSLLFVAVGSIFVRRIILLINYYNYKKIKDII